MDENPTKKLWKFSTPSNPTASETFAALLNPQGDTYFSNPWGTDNEEVDKMEIKNEKDFNTLIKACRFFYLHDPIAATTINKLIEIGINELEFDSNGLTDNELKIFESLKDKFREYAEAMALEYLISGLVVPEISYGLVAKEELSRLGIKKYKTLVLPTSMWIRDPATVKINSTLYGDKDSFFVEIPNKLIEFIKAGGVYPDGTRDRVLYDELKTNYPDFVSAVMAGETYIRLDNRNIFRRRRTSDSPYPIPFLFPSLDSLKHKRNLRRMDYSLASRVITAIQLITLGSDEFPVTEDDDEQFAAIRQQMIYRNSFGKDIERVFQLFGNHTLKIQWVMPDVAALLDEKKYQEVNQDIIYGMGFPRILITGETEKSGAGNQEFAMFSPKAMMDNFRAKILTVLKDIVFEVQTANNIKETPVIRFKPLTLFDYQTLLKSLADLYSGGNLSRTSYSEILGHNWDDEITLREKEKKVLEEKGLDEIAPTPFSKVPNAGDKTPEDNQRESPVGKKTIGSKPSDVNKTSPNS